MKTLEINRRYDYVRPSEMPKKLNFFKRWLCKHELVDDLECSEDGLTRISGQDHVVYCTKCGHIQGYWSKNFSDY